MVLVRKSDAPLLLNTVLAKLRILIVAVNATEILLGVEEPHFQWPKYWNISGFYLV